MGPSGGRHLTLPAKLKEEFLTRVSLDGNVSRACKRMGLNRSTVYQWRADPDFARMWDAAFQMSEDGLREDVIETARALGLGSWTPVLDEATGEPVLDDDFDPLMRFDVSNVDVRVLTKFMDKALQDPVKKIDQRTELFGHVEQTHYEVVYYDSDGSVMDLEATDFAD